MDEIEYKLNTKNSVLVVNAVDKLISTIKSKYKPGERQKFVLENEELKYLREKCSSEEAIVSLTACQGLLALVELGVLEIAHTMSTIVTLLPSAHNYSAIISTMTGLLILDLKSRLVPGQLYKCQFSLKSPQHPFITVLEKNKGAEDDVFTQMQALCTHTDYLVSSNSLELLRPVFFYLTCHPGREGGARPWQLLLSLPRSEAQDSLLLACLSCQQLSRPALALQAYSRAAEAARAAGDAERCAALLPLLARLANQMLAHGRDPRPCYHQIECCLRPEEVLAPALGVTLHVLSRNLANTAALYLHDTLHLCLNIISKHNCPSLSVNAFVAQMLQWLYLPSYLTTSALEIASKILEIHRNNTKEDTTLYIPNLMSNKTFKYLVNTDNYLAITVKVHSVWERLRDDNAKLKDWFKCIESVPNKLKLDLLPFFYGVLMEKNRNIDDVALIVLKIVVGLVDFKKEVAVELLPILLYKVANDESASVRFECLKALPLMAKIKENVPTVVSILNKLKANKGLPTPVLIMLYTSLAETQVRCFPYLQEMLADSAPGRSDDLKLEVDLARILAVKRMCEIRPSPHGLELVGVISRTLSRCSGAAAGAALAAVAALWRARALRPLPAWRALRPKLARDARPTVQLQVCKLLSVLPPLLPADAADLSQTACAALWRYISEGEPQVVEAAATALAEFSIDHYTLKDVPEIYRKTVKLPASFCKTPADAARKPEDVLDYIPCEIWPEVFKYTNQAALRGVSTLARRLIEREVKGFRSGVYQYSGREPSNLSHLPHKSVLRGVMDGVNKQLSFRGPEWAAALAGMLGALCGGARPLPAAQLRGVTSLPAGRRAGLALAARQARVSPSAKAIIEDWVQSIQVNPLDESDIILFYELLPPLTRTLPPNSLRGPLEKTLSDAFAQISHLKAKQEYSQYVITQTLANLPNLKTEEEGPSEEFDPYSPVIEGDFTLFEKQLKLIERCLQCDSIHDANRTLLSQIVEHYFSVIPDDNVAWASYVGACGALGGAALERLSARAGWWQAGPARGRRGGALRAAQAARPGGSLLWLHDTIDAHTAEITEQESSLRCMFPAFLVHPIEDNTEWFLQLLARTQVAFNESREASSSRYLFSVFSLAVQAWAGLWALAPPPPAAPPPTDLLPAAVAALLDNQAYTTQLLEWVSHSRATLPREESAACARTILCALHSPGAAQLNLWTRLENCCHDILQEA